MTQTVPDPGLLALGVDGVMTGATSSYEKRLGDMAGVYRDDEAYRSAVAEKGADFLVWAKDMPAKITAASYEPEAAPRPRRKKRVARAPRRQQDFTFRYAPAPRAYSPRAFNSGYPRWPF